MRDGRAALPCAKLQVKGNSDLHPGITFRSIPRGATNISDTWDLAQNRQRIPPEGCHVVATLALARGRHENLAIDVASLPSTMSILLRMKITHGRLHKNTYTLVPAPPSRPSVQVSTRSVSTGRTTRGWYGDASIRYGQVHVAGTNVHTSQGGGPALRTEFTR